MVGTGTAKKIYMLPRDISAIQVTPDAKTGDKLGTISRLPGGTHVTVCGPGFNPQTIRVSSGGASYFIFLEDVEPEAPVKTAYQEQPDE